MVGVERWGYLPSAPTRAKIAAALDVPVDAIWPTTDDTSTSTTTTGASDMAAAGGAS